MDGSSCVTDGVSLSISTRCVVPRSPGEITCCAPSARPVPRRRAAASVSRRPQGDLVETFTSFDGTTIAYREWGSEYGTVPVVLHHGFAADSLTNWVTPGVADRIVATGRRVVALDARGHGKSGKPRDVAAYRDGQMVTDVSRLIDHLRVERIDLVGYSMGGRVAVDVACNESRLRSVVISGIGGATLDPQPIDRSALLDAVDAPAVEDVQSRAGR